MANKLINQDGYLEVEKGISVEKKDVFTYRKTYWVDGNTRTEINLETIQNQAKRITELESALRGLLEAGYEAGLHDVHCHFCNIGADIYENIEHEADCAYVKAQRLRRDRL